MALDILHTLPQLPFVTSSLNYMAPGAVDPAVYICAPPQGQNEWTFELEAREMPIYDVRGHEGELTLDIHGMAFCTHNSAVGNFYDNDQVQHTYYKEVEAMLLTATGAARAFIFDHTIRSRDTPAPSSGVGSDGRRGPVYQVHNDYTTKGATQRVRALMGDEAEALLQKRFQIYSVWRPIRGPVLDCPLAALDVRTAATGDFVNTALIYTDRIGEIYYLLHNPEHKWYYLSGVFIANPSMQLYERLMRAGMMSSDVMLLKTFDSLAAEGVASMAPHSAFSNPLAPPDAPPRESIEVRSLVFFE